MKPNNKQQKVRNFLIEKGSINTFQAIELGCTRLSAIIFVLKSKGWEFKNVSVRLKDNTGVEGNYTQYTLVSKP